MLLLHPDELSIKLGKLESDELLFRREMTMHLLQEAVTRTNMTIDALDDKFDNRWARRSTTWGRSCTGSTRARMWTSSNTQVQ
jgi:hypothetical protein